jgi:hypothetical protein
MREHLGPLISVRAVLARHGRLVELHAGGNRLLRRRGIHILHDRVQVHHLGEGVGRISDEVDGVQIEPVDQPLRLAFLLGTHVAAGGDTERDAKAGDGLVAHQAEDAFAVVGVERGDLALDVEALAVLAHRLPDADRQRVAAELERRVFRVHARHRPGGDMLCERLRERARRDDVLVEVHVVEHRAVAFERSRLRVANERQLDRSCEPVVEHVGVS